MDKITNFILILLLYLDLTLLPGRGLVYSLVLSVRAAYYESLVDSMGTTYDLRAYEFGLSRPARALKSPKVNMSHHRAATLFTVVLFSDPPRPSCQPVPGHAHIVIYHDAPYNNVVLYRYCTQYYDGGRLGTAAAEVSWLPRARVAISRRVAGRQA